MARSRSSTRSLAFLPVLAVALAVATGGQGQARADEPEPARPRYFYHGYDYGSQALWNPAYLILNRGFDALQLRLKLRNPLLQRYELNAGNVVDNMALPFRSIESYGAWRFVREEILPGTFTGEGARWAPNYGLHLIGGGLDYVAMREWYEDQGVPAASFAAGVTLYLSAFLNETIENYDISGPNTDALADLYIFDLAGVLLFSIDDVAHFFSHTIIVSDWSLQPTYTAPLGNLHNQGNYFAAKWPLPFYEPLRLFGYSGYSSMAGLSYLGPVGYSLSVAGGVKVAELRARKVNLVDNVIGFKPAGAIFLDRNESLLASLQVSDVKDYFIHLNVYPNAFFHTEPGVGFFGVVGQDGSLIGGISFTGGLFGLGAETP